METAEPVLSVPAGQLDAGWLATRRWFRGKARRLAAVTVEDAAKLPDGGAWLLVLRGGYQDGGEERYLVPVVADAADGLREPVDGEGAWRGMLAALAAGGSVATRFGRFLFGSTMALAELLPGGLDEAAGLDEHRLTVEQSNTSVRLGERLIMKVYRLLESGANPELEVNRFLTEVGFPHAPALAGWAEYEAGGPPATALMLQALVASRGDGWRWALNNLAMPPHGPVEVLAGAAQIGGITAEMHAALASRPDAPGFAVAPASKEELSSWRSGAERQLDGALRALAGEDRARLEKVEAALRARISRIEAPGRAVTTRVHGDYHLGQLLRTESGFMVVDFEGEPARPMDERRRPTSPLRDVAGMLRSLDYAARTVERDPTSGLAAEGWLADARLAFLNAYGRIDDGERDLLAGFEVEKACYEVRYEANNRPDWTWLPLEALERLAA